MKLNKKDFLLELKSNKVDVNMSLYLEEEFSFSDVFGTRYDYDNPFDMKCGLSYVTKKDLSNWEYDQGYWLLGDLVPTNIKKEVEVKVEVKEEVILPTEPKQETKTVDWEWVNGLKNTKEDKKALDEYAESEHDIKLKRTMSLENMIKDFKEKLGE